MKSPLLWSVCALTYAFTMSVSAQTRSETFQLGSRTVKIPAPDGFADVFSRLDRLTGRVLATEDPGNEALATHLPKSAIAQFETNQDRDLEFYTKVSISKDAKTVDITPEMYGRIQSSLDKDIGTLFGTGGKLRTQIGGITGKRLSELWGNETDVRIDQPLNLGVFDRGENVISSMMFLKYEMNNKKFSMLATLSFLSINQRLVFVYAYRTSPVKYVYSMSPGKKDIETLLDFTKKWTAAIVAAN